jgi:hypothetical protein
MEEQQQSQSGFEAQEPSSQQRVDIVTLALWMLEELQAQAWIKLGLWKDPTTGDLQADLPQAKIAIDCVAALVGVLEPHLTDSQRRELQRLLTDLRLNFVQRSAEAPSAASE